MKKFRILGYYHFPNQDMKPEEDRIQEAMHLAPLFEKSLLSIYQNPDGEWMISFRYIWHDTELFDIGQTVFLTKEEAEQKLANQVPKC